jgi:hypothetical protein
VAGEVTGAGLSARVVLDMGALLSTVVRCPASAADVRVVVLRARGDA